MSFPIRFLVLCLLGSAFVGCATTGSHTYNVPGKRPTNPQDVEVKVSLANQAVYVMERDKPLLVTATCSGRPGKETPTGHFRVYLKKIDKRSGTYGFWKRGDHIQPGTRPKPPPGDGWTYIGYPLTWWVEYAPAYGFHEGSIWPEPRTAGCLRIHRNVAPTFFEIVPIGARVHVAQSQPLDATLGKKIPRPTDYAEPDPPLSLLVSPEYFRNLPGPTIID
ncbi:MAG: hypothetical protein OHK005_14050 [Candidatus Methylacidiphilales bacterium]